MQVSFHPHHKIHILHNVSDDLVFLVCKVGTMTSTLSASMLQGYSDKLGKEKMHFKSKRERRVGESERE